MRSHRGRPTGQSRRRRATLTGRRETNLNNEAQQRHEINVNSVQTQAVTTRFNEPHVSTSLDVLFDDLPFKHCLNCQESWPDIKMRNDTICFECSKDQIKFAALNDMDPGDVPQVLKDLNDKEEQLIGRVKVVCSVYKLKGGGQLSYSESVIHFLQDTNELARKLPNHPATSLTIVVATGTNKDRFKVSAARIRAALVWLKNNDTYLWAYVIGMRANVAE